jgi:Conserved hypothetical ATP binding protein
MLRCDMRSGLLACMEYLEENLDDWLGEELESFGDDDYIVFDCPGQIELYSNSSVFCAFTHFLQSNGWHVRLPAWNAACSRIMAVDVKLWWPCWLPERRCHNAIAGVCGLLPRQSVRDRGEQVHCRQPAGAVCPQHVNK